MEKIRWLFCIFKLAHITSTCLDADYSARLCPPQSIAPRVWNRVCGKGKGVGQMARDPFHKAAQFFFLIILTAPLVAIGPWKHPIQSAGCYQCRDYDSPAESKVLGERTARITSLVPIQLETRISVGFIYQTRCCVAHLYTAQLFLTSFIDSARNRGDKFHPLRRL